MIRGFTEREVPDQSGKTFVVTGANTGIGYETARALAAKGARVLLGCRTRSKAEAAITGIRERHPQTDLAIVDLDLGSLASVREAAAQIAEEPRLDGLINNAGIMIPPRQLTVDGFESQFGVNHLGPFALTGLLLPTLRATEGARIVNTSSNGHRMGDVDFDDLTAERSYRAIERYGASKLANLLHAYELDRRLQAAGATTRALAVHPGGTDTELFRHLPSFLTGPLRVALYPFLNRPHQGAWPTLAGATHPDAEGGSYFGPGGPFQIAGPAREVRSNRKSHDRDLARRLWDVSVELTGVDPGV